MAKKVGISTINGKQITIAGNRSIVRAVRDLGKFGLITFSREIKFKSTVYAIHFFKPTAFLRNMYSLGNEVLVISCEDGMKDFKSRTKDFIDYILVTNSEFKNRLDKVTCIVIDGNEDILKIVKNDRSVNPDSRIIVPFCVSELDGSLTEEFFNNRMREFLYEKDLFGIAVPLRDDTLFYGKDRTNVISELYARYMHGEEGGLFGLRRIGKTSILYLLKKRIRESGGIACYFDCSSAHHYRWNEFLKYIVENIISENEINSENENISDLILSDFDLSEERYSEKKASQSFAQDIQTIYQKKGNKRILIILDEIESISHSTSPSESWGHGLDALFFWQAIRSLIQMRSECMAFVVAGVNPMCIEMQKIGTYDNPIFGMLNPIYVSLFEYDDIKKMISDIGGRLGLKFEDEVFTKLMEDYGGHPFLIRQVCSKINNNFLSQNIERPANVTRYSYVIKNEEYRQGMTSVIEQILGVIENYYPTEFELLKRLALDGRNAFKKEVALGEKGIQHLVGYCLIEKSEGEYFIRIKSIEDYIRSKYIYDSTLDEQRDKRARINIRRDDIEGKLRELIKFTLKTKYGKKAKEHLIAYAEKATPDKNQKTKMLNASSLSDAITELYLSQIKGIIDKEWKNFATIFPDKSKYEAYMDILNRSRNVGAHAKPVSDEDEVTYGIVFDYFEKALEDV
ncbi:hypothetical protein SAMN06296386_10629 [Lachnospiraceae bacterium]|nr:hypothetical protein SAMN06296386_10629 [Lachnospiraceae bacterium]